MRLVDVERLKGITEVEFDEIVSDVEITDINEL